MTVQDLDLYVNICLDELAEARADDMLKIDSSLEEDKYNLLISVVEKIIFRQKENARYGGNSSITEDLTDKDIDKIARIIYDNILGYGKIQKLINERDDISDIRLIRPDLVRAKSHGKRFTTDIKFNSDREYRSFIEYACRLNGHPLSPVNANPIFGDAKRSPKAILRIDVLSDYITSNGYPMMHIRKIPKEKQTMEYLIKEKMMTPKEAFYLEKVFASGCSLIFTGKGGSGKTTLMNALIDKIPFDKSVMAIQEIPELFSKVHPEFFPVEIRIAENKQMKTYDLEELARYGLRTDLDYYIIGETKGKEAYYLLSALMTGHVTMFSSHGVNCKAGVDKALDYMKQGSDYSITDLYRMIGNSNLISVYMNDFGVREICEIGAYNPKSGDLTYNRIFSNHEKVGTSLNRIANLVKKKVA